MKREVVSGGGRRRPGSGIFCLVLLGLTLGALGHVAVQAKKVEVALALGKEQGARNEMLAEHRHLEIELGRLKDPARLVKLAQESLGMTSQPADIRTVLIAPAPLAPPKLGPRAAGATPARAATTAAAKAAAKEGRR
jgi:cell division protein FtsL